MPQAVKPMLCTLLKRPFNDPAYLFEVKWDGYRLIVYKDQKKVKLVSRGGLDYTRKYPPIVKALEKFPHNAVLDGEAVVLNKEGKPDFDSLQKFNGLQSGIIYYAFDILWLDGKNLMQLPLVRRKEMLRNLIADDPVIRYSEHFEDGLELFSQAESMGLEGIIAKEKNSPYTPDRRGKEWYKIPTEVRQEFVIGGWVESDSRLFKTLLFGAYKGSELHWIGHAGGGFKDREMSAIMKKLKRLETDASPFINQVDYEAIVHWVRPELVANIKYATTTRSGKIRKPAIFLGFRDDKFAKEVVVVTSKAFPDTADFVANKSGSTSKQKTHVLDTSAASNWPLVESEKITNSEFLEVDGCAVRVYNVDRELWKKVTKAHLIQYYHNIAPFLLPHIRDRALSLHLKLNGPNAPGAYIKDMEGRQPDCAQIFTTARKHLKAGKRDVIDYLVCNNTATLIYSINLGCIDVNPWTSRIQSSTRPDYIVIDLDPSDKDFSKAIETARASKQFFDQHKLKAFAKTSGKTGIHIFLPCTAFSFVEARNIAGQMCIEIQSLVPGISTTEISVSARGTKLYLDPNQNDYADTVAAPYCVRPYKRPTVSTPFAWRELNTLDPLAFNINTMQKRLEKKGDLFAGVLDKKLAVANDRVLKKFVTTLDIHNRMGGRSSNDM